MANSMPARLPSGKMGSSVPMNIPMYTRFNEKLVSPGANLGMAPGNVDDDLPFKAPFIPPHEMSQGMATTQAFALSLSNGESLSDMKRKRLRERTAILRLTGFLEDRSMDVGSPQGGSSNSTAVHVERTLVSGCLSKALVAMFSAIRDRACDHITLAPASSCALRAGCDPQQIAALELPQLERTTETCIATVTAPRLPDVPSTSCRSGHFILAQLLISFTSMEAADAADSTSAKLLTPQTWMEAT
eukprot:gene12377-15564_t